MKHYLGICLLLLTLAAIAFYAVHSVLVAAQNGIDHTIADVTNAFGQVLKVQPQVAVNQRVVLSQTAPIAELAVTQKEELITLGFTEHYELWSLQVPLTEKKVTVEAPFLIKSGFDLKQPFNVTIDPTTHKVQATMPHAKILSVEQSGDLVYHAEDATLNRITDDERTKIVNNLNVAAHDAAEKSSLKQDAEQQVAQRLQDLMVHNGQSVEIEWTTKTPQPTTP